jgi:hypothetical protein
MPFATIPYVTKCRLQLQMVAYAIISQFLMGFGFPFN